MSTEIAKIKGINGELILTQYYGGKKNGLCLQLSPPLIIRGMTSPSHDYSQLNKAQVQQLVKELQNWLGEVELPFNQSFAGRLTQFPIPPYEGRK